MGSSQKSDTSSKTTIRYAAYIESKHAGFLSEVQAQRYSAIYRNPFGTHIWGTDGAKYLCIKTHIATPDKRPASGADYADYWVRDESIYTCGYWYEGERYNGYEEIEVDNAFFGVGYTIASFPSLYDMYGKFMAGLDIEVLWTQEFDDTVNSSVVGTLVSAQAALLDDDIETNSIPRLQTGARDINSVMSSSFVVGRSIVEDARAKSLAKFDAELRYRLIPVAESRWQTHLQWNQQVVSIYAELMKFYYATIHDVNEDNYAMATKSALWPFTVLDYERAALGALQGATNQKTDVAGASTVSRVLSGALSGAAMGAMVGSQISTGATTTTNAAGQTVTSSAGNYGGVGAIVGAGLGIAAALTY